VEFCKKEIASVLDDVMGFWSTKVVDADLGGFYGALDFYGNPIPNENKGIILNTRLLWSFAKVSNHFKSNKYKCLLDRSYNFLHDNFTDPNYGGVFWELQANGEPLNKEKKCIAQAYMLLALSEFYMFSTIDEVKKECLKFYELIEDNFYDPKSNFYYNTLSHKLDASQDTSKNLGTHLHILEAYTSLYRFHREEKLKERIQNLLQILIGNFLKNDKFCELDLDHDWNSLTENISLGHNAEVPCMLLDACKMIQLEDYDSLLKEKLRVYCQDSISLLQKVGGLYMFKDVSTSTYLEEFQWWTQTESIIAFQQLYDLTLDRRFIQYRNQLWNFIKSSFIDHYNGEWYEKLNADKHPIHVPKVNMWKSPYHIIRMCLLYLN